MIRIAALSLVVILLSAACNLQDRTGTEDPSGTATSTTTTTTEPPPTTTTVTLPPEDVAERGVVTAVIDGDTLVAVVEGAEVEVRLLGVNAPETDECFGGDARSALARRLATSDVVLEPGPEDVDDFGRALRYLYVDGPEGTVFVNQDLVADGLAVGLQNGHPRQDAFKALEAAAFASGRGMWGAVVCGEPEGGNPDWPQVRISEVAADPEGSDDEALDQELVVIVNEGYGTVSLAGWLLRDESSSNRLMLPAGTGLNPGETLTVVTGCGAGSASTVYWCSDTPVWSNTGDTAVLMDRFGNAVARFAYGPTTG